MSNRQAEILWNHNKIGIINFLLHNANNPFSRNTNKPTNQKKINNKQKAIKPGSFEKIGIINFLLHRWRSCSCNASCRGKSPSKNTSPSKSILFLAFSAIYHWLWLWNSSHYGLSFLPGRNTIHVIFSFAEASVFLAKDTLQKMIYLKPIIDCF